MAKHIIYTDDINVYVEQNKDIIEIDLEDSNEEVNEENIEARAYALIDFDTRDLNDNIECFNKKHHHKVLALASLGLWYGRVNGGKIFEDLSSALSSAYEDTNTLFFNKKNTTLELEAIHHDGTNYFKFYELTDKGELWLLENEYRFDRETLHKKLLANNYVRAITEERFYC